MVRKNTAKRGAARPIDRFPIGRHIGGKSLYITAGVDRFPRLLAKLGKHKAGKWCLYIKKLDDVNLSVLEDLVKQSVENSKATYS